MKTLLKTALAISAVALLLGGVAFAYAAPAVAQALTQVVPQGTPMPGTDPAQIQGDPSMGPPGRDGHGRGGGNGQVASVSADSLTVTLADGQTMTATLTSNTQVTILATGATGSVSDIKVGDSVRVMGRPDTTGATMAAAVVILPAGDEAEGRVSAANGSTLTLENRDGTTSVTTGSTTTFRKADGTAGTLADVTTGTFVEAYGQKQADGSLVATLVLVNNQPAGPMGGDPQQGPKGRGTGTGQVTAVSADSLTVSMTNGQTITATLTSNTQVTILATGATGLVSDIKVGDNVRLMGKPDLKRNVTAAAVVVLPAGDQAQGKVSAANGSTLTLENRDGTTSVTTNSSTTFRKADGTAGTLADVTTGTFVEAYGQKQADGSLVATLVLVNSQPAGPMGGPHGGPQGGPQGPGAGQGNGGATVTPQP
jgi:hypothetical protein